MKACIRLGWCYCRPRDAKDGQSPPEGRGEARNRLFFITHRRNQPCSRHLDLGLWPPDCETIRSCWWAPATPQFMVHCYGSPRNLTQLWTQVALEGHPGASKVALVVKTMPANAEDARGEGSIPGLGRSPGGGHGDPLQDSSPENPMDRGAWWALVRRVAKSWTQQKQLSLQAGPSEVWSGPTASSELLLWTESQLNLPVVKISLTSVPRMSYGHADLFSLSAFKVTEGTQDGCSL